MKLSTDQQYFMRRFCASCTACRIFCATPCDVAKYASSHYEKVVNKYNENDQNMIKTYDYVKQHLRRKSS